MSGDDYLIIAYVVGLGLLWGYGLTLVLAGRAIRRRQRTICNNGPGAES